MELKEFFEIGAEKAGSLTALGMILGHGQGNMSNYKAGKHPFPVEDCVKLADYIGADKFEVIAAAKYACSKNEEKKAFWRPFVEHARAALIAVCVLIVASFVTPTPAEAAPMLKVKTERLCIMLNRINRLFKKHKLNRNPKLILKSLASLLRLRPLEHETI